MSFLCTELFGGLLLLINVVNPMTAAPSHSSDCLYALFKQAGVRATQIQNYVQVFRQNGLTQDVLFDLSFLDLVKLLQSKSFNISHAGDVFRLHTCVSNRGACLLKPFCVHGSSCIYDDDLDVHSCKCAEGYEGVRCKNRVVDRLGRLEASMLELSRVTSSLGVSYTHWGKQSCNDTSGAILVYNGYMAGQFYTHVGGGSNHLCLPFEPQYSNFHAGRDATGLIYGAEFQAQYVAGYEGIYQQNPTCSVCHVAGRSSQIMIPARYTCPPSWTLEYHGYLMTEHYTYKRSEFICVATHPDLVRGKSSNTNGVLLHFVEVDCGFGIDCPPYSGEKELTCAVCTR